MRSKRFCAVRKHRITDRGDKCSPAPFFAWAKRRKPRSSLFALRKRLLRRLFRSGESQLRFQNIFRPHENAKSAFSTSSALKNVCEKLCDELVWTVDITQEMKQLFQSPSVMWTRPNLVSYLFFFSAESYYPRFRESGIIQTLIKMIRTEAINPQTCYNAMAVLESFSLKGLEGFSRCKVRLPNGNLMGAGFELIPIPLCCALDKQSRSQSPLVFCF